VGLNAARPLLAFNPRSRLRQLMAERVPVYEGLAVRIVDTSGREPAEIVTELVKELR
jgi:shikimate kinase